MQNSSHSETLAQFIHSDSISNGGLVVDQATFRVSGTSNATPGMETALSSHSAAELDDDSDSDSEANLVGNHEFLLQQQQQQPPQLQQQQQQQQTTTGPKPGKKTKGRVKIKMEFIENKLRRYTTFSKRKTGIMKKAYELSTLTGTQVMLLVASETGHVYTFATRKLQPMITSESGKALIQTCLNSPDPPPVGPGQQQAVEQRMNPTGFEETELTYAVSEEESKAELKPLLQVASMTAASPEQIMSSQSAGVTTTAYHPLVTSQHPTTTYIPALTTATSTASSAKASNISMQLPPGGITAILQPAGTPITIPFQQSGQNLTQSNTATQQTVYRIPAPSQVVSLGNVSQTGNNTGETVNVSGTTATTTASSVGLMTAPTTVTNGATMTPGIVMYQTPQGVVYATPTTATLPDGSIFNFQQPATAISVPQADQQTGAQQIITIPVPVTLAGSQMLQFAASSEPPPSLTEVAQPPQTKKARK